jgi:hypothetical protein
VLLVLLVQLPPDHPAPLWCPGGSCGALLSLWRLRRPTPPLRLGSRQIAMPQVRMPNLPDALLQFVLKVFSPFMYKTAVKVLQSNFSDPAGPLPARMEQKEEFYGAVQQRVDQYLAEQG